jgi:lipoprotein-anchoring transpeptidase ErfK/SrfK
MTLSRRALVATAATGLFAAPAFAQQPSDDFFSGTTEDNGFTFRRTNMNRIDPKFRRQLVKYLHKEPPGSIVVDTRNHFLYVTFENNTALRYGVGVGKEGFQWFGRAQVGRKGEWPTWTPPAEMLKRRPDLPKFMKGGPDNPLGPRALYLYRDGRDLIYRLHGTVEPWSIGHDVSSGCIRLLNEDVIDLYSRAPVGTRVLVLEHLGKPV